MVTLYIHEQGASIRRVHQRLKVVKGDEVLHTVRLRDLERLVLLGNIDLTAQAMNVLLDEGIETVLLSAAGRFRGRLQPAESKNVLLRQAQFQRYVDMAFRLPVARAIIDRKVRNARAMIYRHAHNHPDPLFTEAMSELETCCGRLAAQETPEQLLGIEGDAARRYFAAFGKMLRGELPFNGRSRRPPRDEVNAALSFGYTLLTTELVGLAAAEGLDPQVGLLHDLAYGRPSLALDVLEEFRQPIVDRLVLSLVNRKVLQSAQFEGTSERGVLLNDDGRARFLRYYHKMMDESFACRDWTEDATAFVDVSARVEATEDQPTAGEVATDTPVPVDASANTSAPMETSVNQSKAVEASMNGSALAKASTGKSVTVKEAANITTFRHLLRRQVHRIRAAIEFAQDYAPYLHYGRNS